MKSTTYEVMLEDYLLSQSRTMLVRPQFWIMAARSMRAPDVLGVEMREKVFYLAEITVNPKPTQLIEKLQDYKDGEQRILVGLKNEFQVCGKWSVKPWLFIWENIKSPLAEDIKAFGVKTTFLKDVIGPPTATLDAVPKDWGMTQWGDCLQQQLLS